jgi:hypothetical protein
LFLPLTIVFAFSTLLLSHAHCSHTLAIRGSFARLLGIVMAHVKSTVRHVGGAVTGGSGGEGWGALRRGQNLSD